ncbi:MAG: FliA/WhiG family RNA polymerase sigma factor [Planctomycetota bacterium]|nr:FliA/WhiG family RNA polymerase sigma factor [Planctomycetota bacterium]MCX8040415.1 FliA/WhiG family RNA polymerase sigma factor [Planctomycetota bacterium]MDW8373892.1 FliA/WhiG family RNA polymerase sigma factor [Planctomycetota bacterium]
MGSISQRRQAASAYRQATSGPQEQEVLRHLPLVHTVVERIAVHLPPHIEREDLLQAGVIGLIDALRRYDPARDNAFSTYAVLRIRGAVLDELRARDWVPRGARERAKAYQQAVSELSQELGRLPNDEELARRLGIRPEDLPEYEAQSALAAQVSLDAPVGDDATVGDMIVRQDDELADPARNLEAEDRRRLLARMLATLTEQERLVIKLYYYENLMMKEIAAILGVTESRVCQIHGRVIALLRARFGSSIVV